MDHGKQVSAGQASKGTAAGSAEGGEADRVPVYDSYGRLSRVPETGELEKIETQHQDNRKVIERLGGALGEELSDGMSAWRKGARRPGWERLLERVQSGASDGCVIWHTDRLFRQPRDLELLMDLANKGYTVSSAHGTRDLADPDDRFILRIEVAHAARSSDDTSRRLKRRFQTLRSQGAVNLGGVRRFGFPGLVLGARDEDGERVTATDEQVQAERDAIREAAAGLLDGDRSLASIAREWNAAGLATTRGSIWVSTAVRETLKRPALGGWIVHEGETVGRMDGDPVLDKDTYDRLQAWFAGRNRGRPAGERYLASGMIRCSQCRGKLVGRRLPNSYHRDGTRRGSYYCAKDRRGCGKAFVDMRNTDAVLRELTIARLADPKFAVVRAIDESSARIDVVGEEIRQIAELQQALSDRVGRRHMTLDAFDTANQPLAADLARLQAERADLAAAAPALSAGVGADGVDPAVAARIARDWDSGENTERRAMLARALGRHRLVLRVGGTRGRFDPERIQIVRPDQDPELG